MNGTANAASWHQSSVLRLLAFVVLPPLGFILLWLRPATRIWKKLLGTIALFILTVVYLFVFFGMRLESDGTGIPRYVRFDRPESHYAALERSRVAQRRPAPPVRDDPAALHVSAPTAPDHGQENSSDAAPAANAAHEVSSSSASPPDPADSWTDFRGPHRDGVFDAAPILTAWPKDGLKLLWRQPVGLGYASFTVAQGRAFTIEQRRSLEVVAAYDVVSGRELWTHSWPGEFRETMGGDGPRATPTWHEGRVYALGALGDFHCLDAATGKLLWSHDILSENGAQNLVWGLAASPLIVDDKVIVLPGGAGGKSVVAYNKLTGERIWSALDDKQAYTSPIVVTLSGQRQLLIVSAKRVMGLSVEEGKLLWDYPWTTEYDINSAQPLVTDENHIFISAGYDHGCALLEIVRAETRAGSAPPAGSFQVRRVWENKYLKNKFTSSVLYQSYIYGLDESILTCLDAKTGERKWKGGRYGYGQVLLASGHLIVLSESGELALVKATPESHQELARFSAIEGKTWNHPAIAGGRLLVRNAREMAAFQITP